MSDGEVNDNNDENDKHESDQGKGSDGEVRDHFYAIFVVVDSAVCLLFRLVELRAFDGVLLKGFNALNDITSSFILRHALAAGSSWMSGVGESFSTGASEGELDILADGVRIAVVQRGVSTLVRICDGGGVGWRKRRGLR